MTTCVIEVDRSVQIGQSLTLTPTDIDQAGVRLLVRGQILGGPDDGQKIDSAYELGVGKTMNVGPNVAIALVEIDGRSAVLKVFAPPSMKVRSKET